MQEGIYSLKPLLEGSPYQSSAGHVATPDARPDSDTLLQKRHGAGKGRGFGTARGGQVCSENWVEVFLINTRIRPWPLMEKGGTQKRQGT